MGGGGVGGGGVKVKGFDAVNCDNIRGKLPFVRNFFICFNLT